MTKYNRVSGLNYIYFLPVLEAIKSNIKVLGRFGFW